MRQVRACVGYACALGTRVRQVRVCVRYACASGTRVRQERVCVRFASAEAQGCVRIAHKDQRLPPLLAGVSVKTDYLAVCKSSFCKV